MRIFDLILIVLITLGYYIGSISIDINGSRFVKETSTMWLMKLKEDKQIVLDESGNIKLVDKTVEGKK